MGGALDFSRGAQRAYDEHGIAGSRANIVQDPPPNYRYKDLLSARLQRERDGETEAGAK